MVRWLFRMGERLFKWAHPVSDCTAQRAYRVFQLLATKERSRDTPEQEKFLPAPQVVERYGVSDISTTTLLATVIGSLGASRGRRKL